MNEFWNLDPIYKGFDDPAFEADMAALKDEVAKIIAFAEALPTLSPLEGLRQGIALQEKFSELVNKLAGYASLRQAADTRDSTAGSQMGRVMQLYSGVAAPFAAFQAQHSRHTVLRQTLPQLRRVCTYRQLIFLQLPGKILVGSQKDLLHTHPVRPGGSRRTEGEKLRPTGQRPASAQIAVQDTGGHVCKTTGPVPEEAMVRSLTQEALDQLWDSFYRVDTARTEKGTGLGLPITKAIIELHGGTCHVSNTSVGVEFKFFLP